MATNDSAFAKVFRQEMNALGRDVLIDEILWIRGQYGEKAREEARELVAKMTDEEVFEILRDTAPKPCPECGRVG